MGEGGIRSVDIRKKLGWGESVQFLYIGVWSRATPDVISLHQPPPGLWSQILVVVSGAK